MKRAIVVAAMLAGAGGSAAAEERSIHLMPPGTVVKERFTLIDKSVPLPEGDFVFVASQVRDATHVKGEWIRQRVQLITVYLAQLDGEELRAEVLATTVLDPRFTYSKWEDEPCNREDTLFRLDLSQNRGYQQNCLQVNHITNIYTRQPPGIYGDAYVWLQRRGARLPVEVVIQATVTRIEVGERLSVTHRFNPAAFGCNLGRNPSWATSAWHPSVIGKDAERQQFVASVVEWGKALQGQIDQQLRHPRAAPVTLAGRIHRCRQ
ncbi:MAG TPA: hypothetical protein VFA72_04525 [Burkholderiales bacterium]|nr:hypothetical protein [Burkholderiales bacterium]